MEAPRFNSDARYSSFDDHSDRPLVLEVEDHIPQETIDALKQLEHKPVVGGPWSNATSPTMIEFDASTGVIKGGADVRGHRYAIG